jgi:hypothetical protein
MSNIKTSEPNMNLKPVELTSAELDSVAAGATIQELLFNMLGGTPGYLTQRR